MTERVLVVAAHPDDETLGCGGMLASLSDRGAESFVIFVADGVTSRLEQVQSTEERRRSAEQAMSVLGVSGVFDLGFSDQLLDTVALTEVANAIGDVVESVRPSAVFTHSASDLNLDHRLTLEATLVACRPVPDSSVRRVLSFEVLSSTGWFPGVTSFDARYFFDISLTLDRKVAALNCYSDEMRPWPHARSIASVESLARSRGSSVGLPAAEAFEVLRWLDTPSSLLTSRT